MRDARHDAWDELGASFTAVAVHLRTLLVLRAARRRALVATWITRGMAFALVAIVVVPLTLTGVALCVLGLSQGLHVLWDGRPWLANLGTGAILLGCIGLAWYLARRVLSKALDTPVDTRNDEQQAQVREELTQAVRHLGKSGAKLAGAQHTEGVELACETLATALSHDAVLGVIEQRLGGRGPKVPS
jgi:hypothetical protein